MLLDFEGTSGGRRRKLEQRSDLETHVGSGCVAVGCGEVVYDVLYPPSLPRAECFAAKDGLREIVDIVGGGESAAAKQARHVGDVLGSGGTGFHGQHVGG